MDWRVMVAGLVIVTVLHYRDRLVIAQWGAVVERSGCERGIQSVIPSSGGGILRKLLIVLLSCTWFGVGQEVLPPACKPLTYFGVHGCEPSAQGTCLKGYHKQLACPTNPMMKVPCRVVCVADSETKKRRPTKGGHEYPQGLRPKSVNALHTSTSEGVKGDAIIAATYINFTRRVDFPAENAVSWLAAGAICLSGEDCVPMRINE